MKILIVGTGTIGQPLIKLFLQLKQALGVEEVIFHKNMPELECRGMLKDFLMQGARLAVYKEKLLDFMRLLAPYNSSLIYTFDQALEVADLVIDCTDKGIARKLKEDYYQHLKNKFGFIAQGSEKGFGKPYAFSINDSSLNPREDKFIQVVSCNTHQVLCLLKTLVFDPDNLGELNMDNLARARFYLGRRASDVSQPGSVVGVEVSKPTDLNYGSHQGQDAARVLATITEKKLDIHTSADTLNNSYMHVVHFDIALKENITLDEVKRRFRRNPLTAATFKMTNNQTFASGRDRGHYGRILNQTVVCLPSLEVISDNHEIIGRCFTPQDGNALLSSVAAALWFKDPKNYMVKVKENLFQRPFLFDEV